MYLVIHFLILPNFGLFLLKICNVVFKLILLKAYQAANYV